MIRHPIGTNISKSFFIDADGYGDVSIFDSISIRNASGSLFTKDALDNELWDVVDIKKNKKNLTLKLNEADFN